MNNVPGEQGSMKHDEKKPRGSAPEMATETIATTFDKGGNDKPLSWENGESEDE